MSKPENLTDALNRLAEGFGDLFALLSPPEANGPNRCALPGDSYHFAYPKNPCTLKVVRIGGHSPRSMVFFEDGSWARQENLSASMRVNAAEA